MAKKPSEMSNVEAWNMAVEACCSMLRDNSCPWPAELLGRKKPPFPPDPVERVSDDALVAIETFGTPTPANAKLMALELIERRAKDKGEKP